jgi:hypothetical protein
MNSRPVIHTTDLPGCISGAPGQSARQSPERIVPVRIWRGRPYSVRSQLKGDKLIAEKLLGIGKATLYRKLKAYEFAQ